MWKIAASGLMILCCAGMRAETLDRIAVTVGSHVIAESDLLRDLRNSAFLDGKPADFSPPAKRAAAQRLVDQYLILEDAAATRAPLPNAASAAPLLDPIKARYPNVAGYRDALQGAGITEGELTVHLLTGLRLLRYSETRFRPDVDLSEEQLRAAYGKLPPGERPASFEAGKNELEQYLTNQRINNAMDQWLEVARAGGNVIYRDEVLR